MADYPNYCIDPSTYRAQAEDGSRVSRADSGVPRIQRLWGTVRFSISFDHHTLSFADYLDLLEFYRSNLTDSAIRFVDPRSRQAYAVSMTAPPVHTGMIGTKIYRTHVELEGVIIE